MDRSYNYSVLRFQPDPRRGEIVNIGLMVFLGDRVDVRLLQNRTKAQALAPHLDLTDWWRNLPEAVAEIAKNNDPEKTVLLLKNYGALTSSPIGWFACKAEQYEARLTEVMRRLITPPSRPSSREGKSRLATEIKNEFKRLKILGKSADEINDHKVVADFPMPGEEDLVADFIYKNGSYHLTQVVDYRTTLKAVHGKIKEVSLKAITLHQSDRLLGNTGSKFCLIWMPPEFEDIAKPHIDVLGQYADEILLYNKENERKHYWKRMADIANTSTPIQ